MDFTTILPDKEGAEDPKTYDWQWQFNWLDPADGVTPYSTAKVYGLAMHARDLELKVKELEEELISLRKPVKSRFRISFGWPIRWTRPV